MRGRRLSSLLMSMIVAVMVGIRESTGLAPPPPLLITEEIEWLSPGSDDEPEADVYFQDPEPIVARPDHEEDSGRELDLLRRLFRWIG